MNKTNTTSCYQCENFYNEEYCLLKRDYINNPNGIYCEEFSKIQEKQGLIEPDWGDDDNYELNYSYNDAY